MEQRHRQRPDSPQTGETGREQFKAITPLGHVGPTLESDPAYSNRELSEGLSPEAQIASQAGIAGIHPEEATDVVFDPVSEELQSTGEPERLKTRLPGDTSSDPHTDLGPDNAATVQWRGERSRE